MYKIEGQIDHVGTPEPYNKAGNLKIDLVITVKNQLLDNRKEFVKIEFMNDSIKAVEDKCLEVGDLVSVDFHIVGRKYINDGKVYYFNNIQGLNIEYL